MTRYSTDLRPGDDEYCVAREDETHCDCWWDGLSCCSCAAPAAEWDDGIPLMDTDE